MSKYESIVPENIASNTFEFYGASIEIETDSVWPYPGYEQYKFFNGFGATDNTPPPFYRNQIKYVAYSGPF